MSLHTRGCSLACLIVALLCPLCGCAATTGRATGNAGDAPAFGWDRIGQAAVNAAASPATWIPAAGALAFQAGHADQKVSDWASDTTPVYGSQHNAGRVSDMLLQSSGGASVATILAVPMPAMGTALVAETGGGIFMRGLDNVIKQETGRTRPNGAGTVSFPSSHSAGAALNTTLIYRNIEYLHLSSAATTVSQISLIGISAATAWARVEAKQHYPSDVLAGAAIGHFFGVFITDAFLGGALSPASVTPAVEVSRESLLVSLHWAF